MKKLNKEDAIMRFKECHFGETPSDRGYNFIAQVKDKYVYGKNEESINSFFKLEKLASCFRIASVAFLVIFFIIIAWVFMSDSLLSIMICSLHVFLGYIYISGIYKIIGKYVGDIKKNVITITIKKESYVN